MTHFSTSSRLGFLVSLLGLSGFALLGGGCSGTPDDPDHEQLGSASSAARATPGPLSVVARFDPDAAELPESVTLDRDGTFYMSMERTVKRQGPAPALTGASHVQARDPVPIGIARRGAW